jgi:hypothetical protein
LTQKAKNLLNKISNVGYGPRWPSEHYFLSHETFPFPLHFWLLGYIFWLVSILATAAAYIISQTYDVNIS